MPDEMQAFHDFMRESVERELDAAVNVGDAARAKELARKLGTIGKETAPAAAAVVPAATENGGAKFTADEAKAAMKKAATWFGKDVDRTKMAREAADFLNPAEFNTADEYAAALKAHVDAKMAPPDDGTDPDDQGNGGDGVDDGTDPDDQGDGAPERRPARRPAAASPQTPNRTAGGSNAVPTKFAQIRDPVQRGILERMTKKNKLKEADVVKNWHDQQQKQRPAGGKR